MKPGGIVEVFVDRRVRRITPNEIATLSQIYHGSIEPGEIANIIRLFKRKIITADGRLPPEIAALIERFEELS